jgi:neopullulanase
MIIQTPEWVKHAVFYQIFPDRFARSTANQSGRGIYFKPWGTPPGEQGFQGGDLYGVAEKLDYLQDLGVDAIYLNPIFMAAANHRYNTYDYLQVDPLLGGDAALRFLLDEAHRRGMRIILDGVFNHCGRGFWPFHHLLENGLNSPYADWFITHDFPLNPYPQEGKPGGKKARLNYAAWWDIAELPKLNTNNPGVRDYLFKVARHWLEFGSDGWRLDVPEEIKDDSFWREFRQVVKSMNPEAYIVGEIWHPAQHHLQGDMFDAVMNYLITRPILCFFGADSLNTAWHHSELRLNPMEGIEFAQEIEQMWKLYDWEIHFAQLNMLDSHDMPRALWLLGEDKSALRLAVLCQMTMPGAPCIYYGDEIGMSSPGDPDCRGGYPWRRPQTWDTSLLDFYKAAIALRKAYPALRTGDFAFVHHSEKTVAYRRRLGDQRLLVVFNAAKNPASVHIPVGGAAEFSGGHLTQVWPPAGEGQFQADPGGLSLHLDAQSAMVLISGG